METVGTSGSLTIWTYPFKLIFFIYLFNIYLIDTKNTSFSDNKIYTFSGDFLNLVGVVFRFLFLITHN